MTASPPTRAVVSQRLQGKVFVFAGRLINVTRREASSLVHSHGGVTRHSVTRNTSYLVVGRDGPTPKGAGRKLYDARRLAGNGAPVQVIEEPEFLSLVGIESAGRLRDRYYTGRDVRRLYGLDSRDLRQLERLSVVSPILKTSAERYYTFSDLLVMRQIHDRTQGGASLQAAARRLIQSRAGQMRLAFDDAREAADKVVALSAPTVESWTADDWYNVGCDHDEDPMGVQQAIDAYERSIELDPYHVGALINLGNLLYDAGEIDKARGLYERALASDAENAIAHFNLGNVYDDLGQYDDAIVYFKKAIDLRPDNADAHFNLGLVYDRVGEVQRVREHMEQYLRLNPQGDMADIAREYLQLTQDRGTTLTRID